MKKLRNAVIAALAITGFVVFPLLGTRDVPAAELISGEVISLTNYMMRGLSGEENIGSSLFHAEKQGMPFAILDHENHQMFIAVYKGPTSPGVKLAPLMGKMVNARGPIYRSHGVQLIEIQIVAEQ